MNDSNDAADSTTMSTMGKVKEEVSAHGGCGMDVSEGDSFASANDGTTTVSPVVNDKSLVKQEHVLEGIEMTEFPSTEGMQGGEDGESTESNAKTLLCDVVGAAPNSDTTKKATESKKRGRYGSSSTGAGGASSSSLLNGGSKTAASAVVPDFGCTKKDETCLPQALRHWCASTLPRSHLSDFLEAMVSEKLRVEGFGDAADSVTVRMTSNCDSMMELPYTITENLRTAEGNAPLSSPLASLAPCWS